MIEVGTKYLNEIFEDEWDTLWGDQPIYGEDSSEVPETKTFTVTIIQPSSAIIEVIVNGEEVHTSTFTARWDDTYSVGFKNGSNPDRLILNAIQGKITRDITIRSYEADPSSDDKHAVYTITILQTDHQTINVLHDTKIKTKTFTAQKYDYYSSTIVAEDGYKPGVISNGSGTVMGDITVSATPATKVADNYVDVKITQSPHQTITVTCNGKNYTSSFAVVQGSTYSVGIVAESGYSAGAILDDGDGVANTDVNISAAPAVIGRYTIGITQSAHQTITVRYNGTNYTTGFSDVPYGTQLTASIVSEAAFNPGTLNATSYKVINDFTFKATAATTKYLNLTLSATSNQVITLIYKVPGGSNVTLKSTGSKQTVSVPYGTTWSASIASTSVYYKAGTLNATSGTVTTNTTVSASAAELIKHNLVLPGTTNQIITLTYKQPTASSSVSVKSTASAQTLNLVKTTTWSADVKPSTGYTKGTVSPESGTLNANTTITVTPAVPINYNFTIPGTSHQTITVSYTLPNGTKGTATSGSAAKTIVLPYSTKWSASLTADTGYNAGTINPSNGTITGNASISVTAVTFKQYTLTIPGTTNQTLYLTYKVPGGTNQTINSGSNAKSITVPYTTTFSTNVTPIAHYDAGKVTPASGTVYGNTTLSITAATLSNHNLVIPGTANQTVTVNYVKPDGTKGSATSSTSAKTLVLPYGTTWIASIKPAPNYEHGSIIPSNGTLTSNTTITVTEATLVNHTLTIPGTTHQVINIDYTLPNGTKGTAVSGTSSKVLLLSHNTKWSATVKADAYYLPGTVTPASGTLTANASLSVTAAVYNKYSVHVTQQPKETVTLTRSDTGATSTTGWDDIPHNVRVTASVKPDPSYTAGTLNATSIINSDFTFTVTPATIITRTLTIKLTAPTRNPWVKVTYINNEDNTVTTDRLQTYGHGTTRYIYLTVKYNFPVTIFADSDPDYVRIWFNHVRQADLHGSESYETPAITDNVEYHCQGNASRSPRYDEDGNYDYDYYGGGGDGGGGGYDGGGDDGHGGGGGDF